MKRLGDLFFLVIQWLLLLYGVAFFIGGAHAFVVLDVPVQSQLSQHTGDTYYVVSPWQRFYSNTISGVLALGLAGVLFRLRHIYMKGATDALS